MLTTADDQEVYGVVTYGGTTTSILLSDEWTADTLEDADGTVTGLQITQTGEQCGSNSVYTVRSEITCATEEVYPSVVQADECTFEVSMAGPVGCSVEVNWYERNPWMLGIV